MTKTPAILGVKVFSVKALSSVWIERGFEVDYEVLYYLNNLTEIYRANWHGSTIF